MICLALMMAGLLSNFAFAKDETENSPFAVEVTYGYNKYVKYGKYIPIYMDITNSGENFQGQVRLWSLKIMSSRTRPISRIL